MTHHAVPVVSAGFSRVWFNSRIRPCQGRDDGGGRHSAKAAALFLRRREGERFVSFIDVGGGWGRRAAASRHVLRGERRLTGGGGYKRGDLRGNHPDAQPINKDQTPRPRPGRLRDRPTEHEHRAGPEPQLAGHQHPHAGRGLLPAGHQRRHRARHRLSDGPRDASAPSSGTSGSRCPCAPRDNAVRTPRGAIRVPTVIVA